MTVCESDIVCELETVREAVAYCELVDVCEPDIVGELVVVFESVAY